MEKSPQNFLGIVKALENSPKGRLKYDTGWDETPNAVTALITTVQELEIDGPNRNILERCYRVHHLKERISLSPKTSPPSSRVASSGRHSLPVGCSVSVATKESSPASTFMPKSLNGLKLKNNGKPFSPDCGLIRPEPRIEIHDLSSNLITETRIQNVYSLGNTRRRLLTPPTPVSHRKKSTNGSPSLKPSPTLSSSTQTQTHSSTTSDATLTPIRNPAVKKHNKLGINDENLDDEKLDEELMLESKISPFAYIEFCMLKYQEEQEKKVKEATMRKLQQFRMAELEHEKMVAEQSEAICKAYNDRVQAMKQYFTELEHSTLEAVELDRKNRSEQENTLVKERKAAASAAEQLRASRKAALEAAEEQERIRIEKLKEEEMKRREQVAILENERLKEKAAEEKRVSEEAECKRNEDIQRKVQVVPELEGLILYDSLTKYARSTELLKTYEEPVAYIDGKDPNTKNFYIGAVKCINTPLNALADTHENDTMVKVQHFSKLLSGEAVSGGGSMTTLFSCTSIPQGDLFVMKTLAFRFVKKSEADVTRGKTTVQPLATVGVHLCKRYPSWASLVQANFYKLCPFLVPFSYPQGDKHIQLYAKEMGHDLSGTETAIQQTFLERMKGYCTLYALMILKFHNDGPFDIGEATDFFTIGGAWEILSRTIKLEPQVDVTATVIHTLLDILDDRLYQLYRNQFTKLMRLIIINYLPKIRNITPPTKSGSLSRLQIYLEKKFSV